MSKDSVVSEPLSRRSAVSLPPRKRLLADFKHSHWSLPLSRSDAIPVLQVKSHLDESTSGEELDDHHLEGNKSEDEQVEESIFSYNRQRRKSKRESASLATRFKSTGNIRNDIAVSNSENDPESQNHSVKESLEIDDDALKRCCGHDQRLVISDDGARLGSIKRRENDLSLFDMSMSRRNRLRQNHIKSKDLFDQIEKPFHVAPSLSDEELARELHRAMNSSPRILGHQNFKPGSVLLSRR